MEKTEEVAKILLCIILTYYFLWQRSLSAVVKSIIFSVNGASNPADLLHNNCPRFHWDTLMSQSKLFIVNSFLSEFSQYFNFFPNVVFYLIWRVSEEIDTTLWSVRHSPRMSYRHSLLKFKLHWHLPVSTLKNLQSPPLSLGPGKGISFFWCFFYYYYYYRENLLWKTLSRFPILSSWLEEHHLLTPTCKKGSERQTLRFSQLMMESGFWYWWGSGREWLLERQPSNYISCFLNFHQSCLFEAYSK